MGANLVSICLPGVPGHPLNKGLTSVRLSTSEFISPVVPQAWRQVFESEIGTCSGCVGPLKNDRQTYMVVIYKPTVASLDSCLRALHLRQSTHEPSLLRHEYFQFPVDDTWHVFEMTTKLAVSFLLVLILCSTAESGFVSGLNSSGTPSMKMVRSNFKKFIKRGGLKASSKMGHFKKPRVQKPQVKKPRAPKGRPQKGRPHKGHRPQKGRPRHGRPSKVVPRMTVAPSRHRRRMRLLLLLRNARRSTRAATTLAAPGTSCAIRHRARRRLIGVGRLLQRECFGLWHGGLYIAYAQLQRCFLQPGNLCLCRGRL